MINYQTGDILSARADALVNTVNCVGVMGRGIALQFKNAFPANFKAYAARCKHGEMLPGRVFVFENREALGPKYIINFPTKRHWRGNSRLDDIEAGLASLAAEIRERDIRSIAVPPLGCGLGGLEWDDVRARMQDAFAGLDDVHIIVFEPDGAAVDARPNRSREVPKMTPGRAALIGLIDRYQRALLDPFVTLLEAHKLLYFMQQAGEPLRLDFAKRHYGPYARNLRHVLRAMEGHYIDGYVDGGDAPDKELALIPGAVEDARAYLDTQTQTQARFAKVADLVTGFESAFGLELLATVHWVMREGARAEADVIRNTHAWGARKKQFSERQITLAMEVLRKKGWAAGGCVAA